MIDYVMLESETFDKRDVRATTDDANAEMSRFDDTFVEAEATDMAAYRNMMAAQRNSEGKFEWIIPGNEVGEFSDLSWEADNGKLEERIDEWNQQILEENQKAAEAQAE